MDELRFTCQVHRNTTTLTVHGSVEADQCQTLRDAITMAAMMRGRGPIVVDLTEAGDIALDALAVLRDAATEAASSGRSLTVRSTAPAPRRSTRQARASAGHGR